MHLKLRSIPFKIITGQTPGIGKFKQIKVFSTVLVQFYKDHSRKLGLRKFSLLPNRKYQSYAARKSSAFYLKVNRDADYTISCLRNWMDIAERMNSAIIVICDNPKLEKKIYKSIWFKDPNIQFITSAKKPFKIFIDNIASRNWRNAACAHLTTLSHAKKYGFSRFWNIDADDTLFLCSAEATVSLLQQAQAYAELHNLNLFSLDMWKSRSFGKHWSWGVTFCRATLDLLSIISAEKSSDWKDYYRSTFGPDNYNSDWHINSLVQRGSSIRIGVFYPINTGFIHWGDLLFNPVGAYVCRWTDKKTIEYPIMKSMGIKELSSIAIDPESVGFSVSVNDEDFTRYYLNNGTWLPWASPVVVKFFGLDRVKFLSYAKK